MEKACIYNPSIAESKNLSPATGTGTKNRQDTFFPQKMPKRFTGE